MIHFSSRCFIFSGQLIHLFQPDDLPTQNANAESRVPKVMGEAVGGRHGLSFFADIRFVRFPTCQQMLVEHNIFGKDQKKHKGVLW